MLRIVKINPFLLAITPVLLFLLFWNLGNQYLWYDEAQNAVLAESVLTYGYPRALIGDFLVSTDETYGIGASYIAQPWLANYVSALAFILFGKSNMSARIFFASFGILSFYLLYALSHRLFKDRFLSAITLFIAATSVPFLLHLRQCRYYSLTIFFTLALLLAYLKFLEEEKYSSILFITASFFLFHANFGILIAVLAALFIHFFVMEKGNAPMASRFLGLYAWLSFLLVPWVFIYKIWTQGAEGNIFSSVISNAKFYLSKINGYFFPYRFLIAASALIVAVKKFFLKEKIRFQLEGRDKKSVLFIVLIIVVNWVFLWFVDFNSMRYMIHIAGLFFIIEAVILKRVFAWNKILGIIFLFLLCFTNLLNTSIFALAARPAVPVLSKANSLAQEAGAISKRTNKKIAKELAKLADKARVKLYFFDYLYEITHDYDGPMEGVVKYLKKNSIPGEAIKTHSFNANPLFFYTGLAVDTDFSVETYPEWIFLRDYWTEESFYDTAYFREIERRYEKVELDYPDIWWENRPDDLAHHYFRTAPAKRKISIYRRVRK